MPIGKIAVTMPGKIGDAIYALPATMELCRRKGVTCDFFTSTYCLPLKRFFEYQPYIDRLIVPEKYQITRMDMGIQPWHMPVDAWEYDYVHHLGFKAVPDIPLPDYMAREAFLPVGLPIRYEYPQVKLPDEPYIILAPRGETSYKNLFLEVIEKSPIRVIQVGGPGEHIGDDKGITGLDILETVSWIAGAKAFIGIMSSQLALANGFSMPKVAVHDGKSWDMRHAVVKEGSLYPINPTAEEVLELALNTPTHIIHSKTLNPIDYQLFDEHQHTRNINVMLGMAGIPHRMEHEHRAWEYGIVLNALRRYDCHTVLDVGGGGSVFGAAAANLGMKVLQVDPGNVGQWIERQKMAVGKVAEMGFEQIDFMEYEGEKADAVVCISTLEHIPDDVTFFDKLLDYAKRVVAITVDFSHDGQKKSDGHIRTYGEQQMQDMIDRAADKGFFPAGGKVDYSHRGNYVYDYNFASLVLVKRQ